MIDSLYEPFKKWSKKGSVYIISDPHLEDPDCKIMAEDWPEPQDYINELKKVVHKNDTLICLGDVGNPEWFNQLKCYKVLILGNHDKGKTNYLKNYKFYKTYPTFYQIEKAIEKGEIDAYCFDSQFQYCGEKQTGYFDEVYEGLLMIAPHIMLSHEPCWNPFYVNLHGHCHGGQFKESGGFNFAANVVKYKPISLGKIIENGLIKNNCVDIHRITINAAKLKKEVENDE